METMNSAAVTPFNATYMQKLMDLGLFEGRDGDQKINARVKNIWSALHHVLAGGEAQVVIQEQGNEDIVAELDSTQNEALKETNVFMKVGRKLGTKLLFS